MSDENLAPGVGVDPELDDDDLMVILMEHTNMGDACEHCQHRFPYDTCISCGEAWPCSAVRLVAELESARAALVEAHTRTEKLEAEKKAVLTAMSGDPNER